MPKLSREERLQKLKDLIDQQRTLSTSELQDALDVSRMTLFRDLELLQEQGYIERLYGSVTLARAPYNINESLVTRIDEKRDIAHKCLSLVEDDDTVFMGAGTTVLEVAKAIESSEIGVTIFTYSLPIAIQVQKSPNIRLMMAGGEYHEITQSFVGPITVNALHDLSARVLIFGGNGFDVSGGITSPFGEQAEILKKMLQSCKISMAVMDSSKFGKVYIHQICPLSKVDYLIVDNHLPEYVEEELRATGVNILIAD